MHLKEIIAEEENNEGQIGFGAEVSQQKDTTDINAEKVFQKIMTEEVIYKENERHLNIIEDSRQRHNLLRKIENDIIDDHAEITITPFVTFPH